MTRLFDIETIAFTIIGYPMSYLELFGTLLNLASVILIARRNMWTWPTGIAGVILFTMLFYQVRLYSDTVEQVYYLVMTIYGWWSWSRSAGREAEGRVSVRFSGPRLQLACVAITGIVAIVVGAFMARIHHLIPALFPEPAAFPYLDSLTTIMSFTAMWLMVGRRTESWVYWIIVDVIGVYLYASQGVAFVAILYGIFLILACWGLHGWMKRGGDEEIRGNQEPEPAGETPLVPGADGMAG